MMNVSDCGSGVPDVETPENVSLFGGGVRDVETSGRKDTTVTEAPRKERALTNATVRNPISGTNKKIDKARKEKQKVDWARSQRLDGVVLNDDQADIISIGRITIKNWTGKMLPAFLRGLSSQ